MQIINSDKIANSDMFRSPTRNLSTSTARTSGDVMPKQFDGTPSTGEEISTENPAEVYARNVEAICKEVDQMGLWLSRNPGSRSPLKEFIGRALEALQELAMVKQVIHITNSRTVSEIKELEMTRERVRELIQKNVTDGQYPEELLNAKEWPESAFEIVKVERSHPLSKGKKGNLALVFSSKKEDNLGLISLAEKAFGDVEDLFVDGTVAGDFQHIKMTSKKDGKEPVVRHGFLVTGGESMKRLVDAVGEKNIKDISMATTNPKDIERARRLAEITFCGKDCEITLHGFPQTREKKIAKVRDYETVRICSSTTLSYADMAGKVKENLDPASIGVEIKGTRKTVSNDILIRTEKGGADKVMKQIKENFNKEQLKLKVETISHRKPLIITCIDALVTENELKQAIEKELGEEDIDMEVKKFYDTKFGDKNAEIWIDDQFVLKLVDRAKFKVGLGVCKIKSKTRIDRCTNCLKIGHRASECRTAQLARKCLNCTKEGHNYKDCKESAFCNECKKVGHNPTSTICPAFRRRVNKSH